MGSCFALIFLGISFLAGQLGHHPRSDRGADGDQPADAHFRRVPDTPFHYLVQIATAVVLVLAANTSFADFPRLASFLARTVSCRGYSNSAVQRLAFNSGIVVLTAVAMASSSSGSAAASAHSFRCTRSASSLPSRSARRAWCAAGTRTARPNADGSRKALINGIGAATTGVVAIEVAASKFLLGAWVVLALIPVLIAIMLFISRQYRSSAAQLAVAEDVHLPGPHREERVIVPVPGINRAVVQALNVARSISGDVLAVLVTDNPDDVAATRERWERQLPEVPLVIVESPYRALVGPLLAYLDVLDQTWPADKPAPSHLRGHPRVRRPTLVGTHPLQPVGQPSAARPAGPPAHRRGQRPVPARGARQRSGGAVLNLIRAASEARRRYH